MDANINYFDLLPDEIIIIIASYLNDNDLLSIMNSSKKLKYLLRPEFEKTHTYGKFLHNVFLAFYITKNQASEVFYNTKYYKKFNVNKYCNFNKLQESNFVISRIGNIWSWKNLFLEQGTFKNIDCQCESEYCSNQKYIVDVNLRCDLLNIAIKLDMWSNFIKPKSGFKTAFNIIKNYKLINSSPYISKKFMLSS